MVQKIDLLMVTFLFIKGFDFFHFLGGIGSVCIIAYYLSMLKKNVINVDFKGSWIVYLKSILKK